MPSKTKLKNAAIAAMTAALPKIPQELIDQFVGGSMSALTLPSENVSLAEWFNTSKKNANDEDDTGGAIHARVQATGRAPGSRWPERRRGHWQAFT